MIDIDQYDYIYIDETNWSIDIVLEHSGTMKVIASDPDDPTVSSVVAVFSKGPFKKKILDFGLTNNFLDAEDQIWKEHEDDDN